jgi:hypothetical protein
MREIIGCLLEKGRQPGLCDIGPAVDQCEMAVHAGSGISPVCIA